MNNTLLSQSSPGSLSRNQGKNKHGLSRTIGQSVRREVRRRCGFGCVICGDAIFTYEHFDPPFKDAKRHDPNGITLLCGGHQLETSKGLLSKATIAQADKTPFCKKTGHASHLFDLGGSRPRLVLGGADVTECGPKIEIDGRPMLKIDSPDRKSSRWRLSCHFTNQDGKTICEIIENELILRADNVDIEQRGSRLSIHSEQEVFLEIELQPPDALLLRKYSVCTENGHVLIGEESRPDFLSQLAHPDSPMKMVTRTTLRLETGGNVASFDACTFVAPEGLRIRFVNGAIQFTSM